MKRILSVLILSLIALYSAAAPVLAQASEYRLSMHRTMGYNSGRDIRGSFTISLIGPEANVQSVTFLMDDQAFATVNQPPFRFAFSTSSYPNGWHNVSARVVTKDGQTLTTSVDQWHFLSAEEQGASMQKIFIPLFGGIALAVLVGVGLQFLITRRSGHAAPGAPRSYGLKGGAICPRCGRPFPIHLWSINLIGGCIDRCDYCGRFGLVTRRSPAELAAAERAETAALNASETSLPGAENTETEEERLRKMLDESRYTK